jgi:hypothetical protein
MARAMPGTSVRGMPNLGGGAISAFAAMSAFEPPPPLATIHGVGVAEPMVNDALTVALKLKWLVKKTIFRLTRTDTPALIAM